MCGSKWIVVVVVFNYCHCHYSFIQLLCLWLHLSFVRLYVRLLWRDFPPFSAPSPPPPDNKKCMEWTKAVVKLQDAWNGLSDVRWITKARDNFRLHCRHFDLEKMTRHLQIDWDLLFFSSFVSSKYFNRMSFWIYRSCCWGKWNGQSKWSCKMKWIYQTLNNALSPLFITLSLSKQNAILKLKAKIVKLHLKRLESHGIST